MIVQNPSELSHETLVTLVEAMQRILYWDREWTPEKEHNSDTLMEIDCLMIRAALSPRN